ncbi:MAG: hypothetical protein C0505_00255 [Leptothrix sp. (in: Bacteria)]|nr:hypothetical protein [Leptothrix sp. (in: b-proteobacteria)]
MHDHSAMPVTPKRALRVRLYGDAAVLLPDGRSVALERRAAALLALVALEHGITRMRAATLLWPDSSDPRRNLRQQLLRFRRQFGQALVDGETLLTLAEGVVLAEAAGELLAGQPHDDDDDFGAWLAAQRHALAATRRSAWQRALAEAEGAGALDTALELAEAAVAAEADSEDAGQALMRVHCLRGEVARGLAAHDRLVQVLAERHGRRPSAATTELAEGLRRGLPQAADTLPATVHAAAALPATLTRPPQLVGRAAELAAARQAWAEGRAVLLEAEAGLGKSRLIAELAGPGALVGAGRPGDAGAPYTTLARWLAPLLGRDSAPLPAPQRQALAHLVPGAGTGPALQRGALDAAVAALLQAHGVACLVLDDLHFADAATLELAAALAAPPDPSCRWLFAIRPAEAPPAAVALRESLMELRRLTVIALAPLDAAATLDLLDALALRGLTGADLAAALVRHTGGNPLYLLETLKQGLQDGSLARGQLPRPAQVGALIDRRLQRLSVPALTLARVAAIAGVDFSIELAEAATGQRAVALAGAWQELQEAQVLRDETFAHDLVADAALRSVPPAVARRVHVQCAQWLAAQGVAPARVAWHWRHGGRPAEAGRCFVAAAQRAEKAARLAEEATLYGQAAAALAEAGLDAERFDALVGRVRALNAAEFDTLAMQECRALLAVASDDSQRLRAHSELCGLLTERGEPLAAIRTGETALALARRLDDREWEVRTACHVAASLNRLGRAGESVALLAPLREWVDTQPDDPLRMLWHGDWGAALGLAGRVREAVAAFEVALAASRRLGLRDAEGRLLLNCAVSLRQGGQFDRALLLSRQGQALSASGADRAAPPIDRLVLARDEAEAGHYGRALPVLEDLLVDFERRGAAFWVQATRQVLVRLWLDLGQHARAVPLLHDEPADMPAWLRADRHLLQLELALALHSPAAAGVLDSALALAASDGQRGPPLRVRALRHRGAAQVLGEAQALATALHAHERYGALLGLHTHVARAALATGHTDAAADAALALLALFDSGHAPDAMYRAEAWWVAHQALSAAGRAEAANRALRAGEHWLRQVALPQVPPAFIDSFLNRNAVNRALLAAAGAGAGT